MAASAAAMEPQSSAFGAGCKPIAGEVSFLDQKSAIEVDEDLMSKEGGFSIDQLMELAGLSVASALAAEYPPASHPRVLIICGPGNNGGDGLVAARHLHHFGYQPRVLYPKMEAVTKKNELYGRLVVQLNQLRVPITDQWPQEAVEAPFQTLWASKRELDGTPKAWSPDVVLDAIFGFSFNGWRGADKDRPFDQIIDFLTQERPDLPPIVSVDIPSGWHVEEGPYDWQTREGCAPDKALRPEMLISLTAPKLCARKFQGKFHYLGGRFVPPNVVAKNSLKLPAYPGAQQCVRLAAL